MIGRTLGKYRVVEQVGLGGMATVYKAYDASMDRYVAVKVLPEHFSHGKAATCASFARAMVSKWL